MKRDADWRHYAGAAVLLVALGVLLHFTIGRSRPPNVPAAAGANPIADTPPERPVPAGDAANDKTRGLAR